MVKEVLLLFKTHLDIGFTDYAGKVTDHYLKVYIPNAIRVGYALKDTDTPFIWSVGSWLLWEALKEDDGTVRRAVEDGIISWHALPFTSYTEMMNAELLEYGLSLSERLDAMFGRKTVSAKMSDVPGHTVAMVKHLADRGVKFLHLGINEASPMPPVPPVFRWRHGGSEITVMYQVSYGRTMEFDDFAVSFGFTGDNCGPQKAEDIAAQYAALRRQYPGAVVRAATLNDVAERICALSDLPVVEKEIGDTWIHGIGTDPRKVSLYRDLLRHIEAKGIGDADLTDNLLLVPEHTWGADLKTFYPEFDTYAVEDFRRLAGTPPRLRIEETWAEQRRYLDGAARELGVELQYDTDLPDIEGLRDIEIPALPFSLSWQLFDRRDYARYKEQYIPHESHSLEWAILDFTKVGIPEYEGGIYEAEPICAWSDGVRSVIRFALDDGAASEYGLPVIYAEMEGDRVEVRWFGQKPLRLPNAYWIRFEGMREGIQVRKLGEWIDADSIVGSPLICGTDYGARSTALEVESLDASLAAPYGRRLLEYDTHPAGQDLYFNLYNNIWNTNHPMWYSDDARFRFVMHTR